MASTSDLSGYDDLTTAFIRHRERKSFDRNLDGKLALFVITKLQPSDICSSCFGMSIVTAARYSNCSAY